MDLVGVDTDFSVLAVGINIKRTRRPRQESAICYLLCSFSMTHARMNISTVYDEGATSSPMTIHTLRHGRPN